MPGTDIPAKEPSTSPCLIPLPGGGTSDSQTFTITADRIPAKQLYYPRLMSSAGAKNENTGIAVANLSTTNDAALTVSAFDTQGAQISGPGITNPVSLSISLKEQRAVTDSQIFGAGVSAQNSVGWIKLDSSEARIAGFFLVFDNNLSTLDGADVSSNTVTSFIFPEIEAGQGFNQFHIANPNSTGATLTFELFGSDGQPRTASVTRTINANGAVAEYMSDLFPGIAVSSSDYLRVTSTRGVVPFAYLGREGRDSEGLNGQDVNKGASVLYSPQYAVGGSDWGTTLSVVNLSNSPTTVTFQLIGDGGSEIGVPVQRYIAGRGKVYVSDQTFFINAGDTLTQGYVEIRSSNGAPLAGSVVFGDPQRARYAAALPLVSTLQHSLVFGQVASGQVGSLNYFTGLALLNPWESRGRGKDRPFYPRRGAGCLQERNTSGAPEEIAAVDAVFRRLDGAEHRVGLHSGDGRPGSGQLCPLRDEGYGFGGAGRRSSPDTMTGPRG